jgi:hypothetical protein
MSATVSVSSSLESLCLLFTVVQFSFSNALDYGTGTGGVLVPFKKQDHVNRG